MAENRKCAPVRKEHGFPFDMTRREYETACLAADGLHNQEIAGHFSLSVNTIKHI